MSQVMVEQSVFSYLKEHEQEMLEDLVGFVKKESPSYSKELVYQCGMYLTQLFQKL